VLWTAGFAVVEDGIGLLGLVTLAFVVAAWKLRPDVHELARGFVPSFPGHHAVRYAFLVVSTVGATVSPYLLNFYSSGTLEEGMTRKALWANTVTTYGGNMFGTCVSMGVLVTSAMVLHPAGVTIESFDTAATMFEPVFGAWGITLFALALGVGCLGAALEITLNMGYLLAQVFGWSWSANEPRARHARFSCAFTVVLVLATGVAVIGFDPLRLTSVAVALTVVIMPVMVLPFLVLMNDTKFVKDRTNSPAGNAALALLTVLGALLALVVIPLEMLGGG
jgi:Mn2+/Fe2+ NRAMP family transporter